MEFTAREPWVSTTPEFSMRKGLETVYKTVYGTEYKMFHYFYNIWMWDAMKHTGTSYGSHMVCNGTGVLCSMRCGPCASLIVWMRWRASAILWHSHLYVHANLWMKIWCHFFGWKSWSHPVREYVSQIPHHTLIFASSMHNEKIHFFKKLFLISHSPQICDIFH